MSTEGRTTCVVNSWTFSEIELLSVRPTLCESVTSVHRSEDGWTVGLEVVESRRIPDSTDLLASYEVEMDADGDLVSYRRLKRYNRGRGDDE